MRVIHLVSQRISSIMIQLTVIMIILGSNVSWAATEINCEGQLLLCEIIGGGGLCVVYYLLCVIFGP